MNNKQELTSGLLNPAIDIDPMANFEKKINDKVEAMHEQFLQIQALCEKIANQQLQDKSDNIDADFAMRLIKATTGFKEVIKAKTVAFGNTKYKYAEIDKVIEATNPALAEHGILVWEEMTDGYIKIFLIDGTTGKKYLRYKRALPMVTSTNPDSKAIQQEGSGMTYIRRYGRMIALSIASEDDDGNNSLPADNKTNATATNNAGQPTPEDTAKSLMMKIKQLQKANRISANEVNSLVDQLNKSIANKNFTAFIVAARDAITKYAEKPQATNDQK